MVEEKLLIDDMSMDELLAGSPERVNTGTVVNAPSRLAKAKSASRSGVSWKTSLGPSRTM